jgi:excisionase family DNA binding protein
MEKRVLNVQEVAEFCGVSISTIYDMVRTGEIPHTRLRNRILFHCDVIDKWLRGELSETS